MYHVQIFSGYRDHKDGEPRKIWIEIHDGGPDVPEISRYHIFAHDEDGRVMASNPCESIEVAIASAQWGRFDVDNYIDPAYVRPKKYPLSLRKTTAPKKKAAAPRRRP